MGAALRDVLDACGPVLATTRAAGGTAAQVRAVERDLRRAYEAVAHVATTAGVARAELLSSSGAAPAEGEASWWWAPRPRARGGAAAAPPDPASAPDPPATVSEAVRQAHDRLLAVTALAAAEQYPPADLEQMLGEAKLIQRSLYNARVHGTSTLRHRDTIDVGSSTPFLQEEQQRRSRKSRKRDVLKHSLLRHRQTTA